MPFKMSGCSSWSALVVDCRIRSLMLCSAVGYTPISTSFLPQFPSSLSQRMKLEDFIRNLRGIDNNRDLDEEMLTGIYERIRNQEFRPGMYVLIMST